MGSVQGFAFHGLQKRMQLCKSFPVSVNLQTVFGHKTFFFLQTVSKGGNLTCTQLLDSVLRRGKPLAPEITLEVYDIKINNL